VPPPTIAMRLICLVSFIAWALAHESRGEDRPFLALPPAAGKKLNRHARGIGVAVLWS